MGFFLICLIIYLGSLVSGAVPFILNLSERHLSLLSAFGAGLLVSTALAIILPEGIEAFNEAKEDTGTSSTQPKAQLSWHLHYKFASLSDLRILLETLGLSA